MSDTTALTGSYTIDPSHSRLGFVVRHAMVTKVRGSFADFEGSVTVDGTNPAASSVTVSAAMASVTTGDEGRDGHLRSADFFDVEANPTMAFVSNAIEPDGTDDYKVTGDLTIGGVTRPVTIDLEFIGAAKDPFGNDRIGFEGRAEINRKDWGLEWNAALETGGILVGEKVKLELDISAVKA
jgi:polyisoprenoid-binding protein YceI